MRTVTITFHRTRSFGAMLQAYSLQQFLLSHGYENQILDYSKNASEALSLYSSFTRPKNLLKNLDTFLHAKSLRQSALNYERFIETRLSKTKPYHSIGELQENPPQADVYIAGSDQIWNAQNGVNSAYYLDFGPKTTKRIAYAASMGKSVIPEQYGLEVRRLLRHFDAISVRESSVKRLLNEYTDQKIQVHIDPTFLTPAEQWRSIERTVDGLEKPYILCFCIYRPNWRNEELKQLHKRTGKDIVLLDSSSLRNIYHNKQVRSAGPEEFLWLIDHADAVVTTSFHGVALSAILGKPLYAIVNPSSSERIQNLLTRLEMEQCIVNNLKGEPFSYDRMRVQEKIKSECARALSYLTACIGSEKNEEDD